MKTTTYMMIGAYVVSLVIIAGFMSSVIFNDNNKVVPVVLGGDLVEIPLEDFDSVSFSKVLAYDEGPCRTMLNGFKGIKVSVSDTLASPQIVMPSDWQKILEYKVTDGCLDVSVNALKIREKNDSTQSYMLRANPYCPVEIRVPEGMLKGVGLYNSNTLYVENLVSHRLDLTSEGRIVLIKCQIDSLIATGDKICFEELKLDDSRIKFADVNAPRTFQLTNTKDSSIVETLQLHSN